MPKNYQGYHTTRSKSLSDNLPRCTCGHMANKHWRSYDPHGARYLRCRFCACTLHTPTSGERPFNGANP